MSIETIVIILIVGGLAGWLAGLVIRGAGFGIAFNILLGIVGGFIGTWVLGELGVAMPGGTFIAAVLTAFVGAALLLFVVMLFNGAFVKRRRW